MWRIDHYGELDQLQRAIQKQLQLEIEEKQTTIKEAA